MLPGATIRINRYIKGGLGGWLQTIKKGDVEKGVESQNHLQTVGKYIAKGRKEAYLQGLPGPSTKKDRNQGKKEDNEKRTAGKAPEVETKIRQRMRQ